MAACLLRRPGISGSGEYEEERDLSRVDVVSSLTEVVEKMRKRSKCDNYQDM